jgi:hypothetical protein
MRHTRILKNLSLQKKLNGRDGRVTKAAIKDSHYVTADVKLVRVVIYLEGLRVQTFRLIGTMVRGLEF